MPLSFTSASAIDTAGSHYENWRQIVVSVDVYHRSPITGICPIQITLIRSKEEVIPDYNLL